MATKVAILREMRAVLRRANALITEAEQCLSLGEPNEESCQIAKASLDSAKHEKERLEVLTSELYAHELSESEEKELERSDEVVIKLARLSGVAANAIASFETKARNELASNHRHSWAHSTTANQASMNVSTMMRNKLPKIKLPSFDGDEQKFLNYKSQFVRLVHNNTEIENEDKMVYLKSSLTGKAERLIRDIPTCAENYQKAWDAIVERYEDRFLIVESHFAELFAIQRIKSTREIRDLIDQVDSVLRSLELSGETPGGWPGIVTYFVFTKLDERTQIDWKKTIQDRAKYATWENLRAFLRANASAAKQPTQSNPPPPKKEAEGKESRKSFLVAPKPPCICCGQQHLIIECETFRAKTTRERMALIRQHKLCANCFNTNHSAYQCKSRKTCKTCAKKHHTLLHIETAENQGRKPSDSAEPTTHPRTAGTATAGQPTTAETEAVAPKPVALKTTAPGLTVLLPSAKVQFRANAAQGWLRALLDTCSQVTLISDAFVRRFRLRTTASPNQIAIAVSGVKAAVTKQCRLTLRSSFSEFSLEIVAEVVPSEALRYVINDLPWAEQAKELRRYELADNAFYQKTVNIQTADLLLGAGYLPQVLLPASKALGQLMLKETQFDWTILGPSAANHELPVAIAPISTPGCWLTIEDIDDNLKRLFECADRDAQAESTKLTKMHTECEAHFERTCERLSSGEFQVRNPYCAPTTELADNYRRALACLIRNETSNTGERARLYKAFMDDYKDKGHMSRVEHPIGRRYFLPHHAVLRPSSTTTRLRAVFNGSAKTASGKSLNEILMVGPKLQPDLFEILLKFRTHKVAFTADIAQMYRCIRMHPEDRPMQSILWRDEPTSQPQVYELNTVTYGLAPASYMATKCLQKLAQSAPTEKVRKAVETQFYMDDLLAGAQSMGEAIELQGSIHQLLASAGFRLRKYQSNSAELLEKIPSELVESSLVRILGDHDALSILGVYWSPSEDVFRIRIPEGEFEAERVTKRKLMSEVARLFDPLGFIAPVTIREKMFIQSLWQQGLAWEQEVPAQLVAEFCTMRNERRSLSEFSVPRPLFEHRGETVDLIGFCDASLCAYCAVVYARYRSGSEVHSVRFVCAKTHVAPVKAVTIPKLELCSALLLAELLDRTRRVLDVELENVSAFSDSQVALAWIAKEPETWKIFVANRVEKIRNVIPAENWGYVPTSQNPADLATRGCSVAAFLESEQWRHGPKFLYEAFEIETFRGFEKNIEAEKKKPKMVCKLATELAGGEFFPEFVDRFSCMGRMTRVFAYIQRYARTLKSRIQTKQPPIKLKGAVKAPTLEAEEIAAANNMLIALVQRRAYPDDYARLAAGQGVKKRSTLRAYNPYLEGGIVRLATRLTNAEIAIGRKRPVVIPAKGQFSRLLVRFIHTKYFHATKAFILSHLTVQYHFTGSLKNTIKDECNRCVVCARYRAETRHQIMGELPRDRCVVSRLFAATGVDFAGPFECKPMLTRSKTRFKIYAAVFVCSSTRAVHLEPAASLSTEDFLNAFQRFASRRGAPKVVYSDNGTNFRGAAKFVDLRDEKIQTHCATQGIKWKFNPPRAPHRGGLWEAAVKSMKYHLVRVTNSQTLNFEQYSTLLARVEAVLNSRPLCYKSGGPASVVLTSGHFLVGDRLTSLPGIESDSLPLSKKFEAVRRLVEAFWRTWSVDYLAQLKGRAKWQKAAPNITAGQVVLLRDDLSKPASWDLAVVERVLPDCHGAVRTVEVRHRGSIRSRDIQSLVPLPVDN